MDNNAAKQSIRGFCVGKKNWVMIDTIARAKSSVIIYSIAETAKLNNLRPYGYFEYLLSTVYLKSKIKEPPNWAPFNLSRFNSSQLCCGEFHLNEFANIHQ